MEDTLTLDATVISALRAEIARELRPKLRNVDGGEYPEHFMRQVGALGGFRQACPGELGGAGYGIAGAIRIIEDVSEECLTTGFCVWCQTTCGWYIQNGQSDYLKESVLPSVMSGEILAGTGLSNPLKHFSGIEEIKLSAERGVGGWVLNGVLPWVSNIGPHAYFGVVAKATEAGSYLMAVVPGWADGLTLREVRGFIALDGSRTYSCRFKDVFVPEDHVLADVSTPFDEYLARIKAGFILTQVGMGLGLANSCVKLMEHAKKSKGKSNDFLDEQPVQLKAEVSLLKKQVYPLAREIGCGGGQVGGDDLLREVIKVRIIASELALRASSGAMLHMGSAGYRLHSTVERKLREAYFIAMVTPALKHMKKILHDMDVGPGIPVEQAHGAGSHVGLVPKTASGPRS